MKKHSLIKKILLVATLSLTILLNLVAFTACGDNRKVIGIIQYGSHASLNNCYEGIVKGLKEGGVNLDKDYKIELLNSNFEATVSAAQAQTLANKKASIISAIATPSAMAAVSASKGKIPVVYCAVSDPQSAGLTTAENVCGTSDLLDFDGQLALIKAFLPSVKRIGVMYTLGEANSVSQVASLKQKAEALNLTIVEQTITNANEIPTACDNLLNKNIDCITNLTDNTVVNALNIILAKANAKNIPIFGSEIEQVKIGCLASASLDYVDLGRQTGLIIANILNGKATADKTVTYVNSSFNCYNSDVATALNISLPSGITIQNVK